MMLVIYGPTVTGKTSLAIYLAKKYNGELISADSRQVYRGLDIGSGKLPPISKKITKHKNYWNVDDVTIWGFDVAEPGQRWTAYDFVKFTTEKINKITSKKKLPIVVGGTGFYIKSLIYGLETMGIKPNFKLRQDLEKCSIEELHERLKKLDFKRLQNLNESDRKNPRRLIRHIEISTSQSLKKTSEKLSTDVMLIGLTAPNEYLFEKADKWLETRIKMGLERETENLLSKSVNKDWLLSLGLEYKWTSKICTKDAQKNIAIANLKTDIHSLIRRQKTFFLQFKEMKKYDILEKNWRKKLEKHIDLCYTQFNGRHKRSTKGRNLA